MGKRTDLEVIAAHLCDPGFGGEAERPADVVLLDSLETMLEGAKPARSEFSTTSQPKRILLAMDDDSSHFLRAIRSGAWAYVLQDASAADVVAAMRSVAEGQAICPAQYLRVLFDYIATKTEGTPTSRKSGGRGLTPREQQLVLLIERGLSNREIAGHLHLSEQTVKNHVHRILRKAGAADRLSISQAWRESFRTIRIDEGTFSSCGCD